MGVAGVTGAVGMTGCLGNGGDEGDGTDGDDGNGDGNGDGNQTGDGDDEDGGIPDNVDVVAGPEGAWRFEPEELEVAVGETVVWYFATSGHNVTSHPDAHNKCENPEGAEPFKSYEGDDHFSTNSVDTTYSHTFETPGEYTYVCVPHATQMVGYITVVDSE